MGKERERRMGGRGQREEKEDGEGERGGEVREGIRRGQARTPCTQQAVHVNRRPSDYLLLCRPFLSSPLRNWRRRRGGEARAGKNTTS